MNTDHWRTIEELFHKARELKTEDRGGFLDIACGPDPEVRRAIEILLQQDDKPSGFLTQPAVELLTTMLGPGVKIGPYEILAVAGVGGMGQVYRAHDTRLKRDVAIKVLPPEFVADPDRISRFQREATLLASLNHPNIAAIYDILQLDGPWCLVLEFVEGPTLAERIREGPIPIDETLRILQDIVLALETAHEKGIVHRDLKPANIKITPNGTVKVLDFGVAKAFADSVEFAGGGSSSVTTTAVEMSLVQGTPGYMSPEQSRGDTVDRRTDIWALGCVIFEMLTGQRVSSPEVQHRFDRDHFLQATTVSEKPEAQHVRMPPRALFSPTPPPPSSVAAWLPKELDAALLAPFQENPLDRPASAGDVLRHIKAALNKAELRSWKERELPRRIILACLLGAVISLLSPSWRAAPIERLESMSVDFRFRQLKPRPPDPRILVVSLDDSSLKADVTPLTEKADEFGRQLERIFQAGARGVAVDLLLPAGWSQSETFSQMVLHRADALTLAALSTADNMVVGPECLNQLVIAALGPRRFSEMFAFVNIDPGADGVTRRGYLSFKDQSGMERKTFAARAALSLGRTPQKNTSSEPFWIDWSVDPAGFEKLSWKDLTQTLDSQPSLFRDRLVVVGAEFAGSGDETHPRSGWSGQISGLLLQSLMLSTILGGLPIDDPPIFYTLLLMTLICVAVASGMLCMNRLRVACSLTLAGALLWVLSSIILLSSARVLILTLGPVLSIIAAGAIGFLLRLRLSAFPAQARFRSEDL